MSESGEAQWRPGLKRLFEMLLSDKHPHAGATARTWREWLLNALLLVGLILGLGVVVVAGYSLAKEGAWGLLTLDVILYLTGLAIYILRSLPYTLRASLSCLLFYLAGAGVLAHLGPYSAGSAYLFTFCILCGVFLGVRLAACALALNGLTLLLLIWAIARGYFPEVLATMPAPEQWVAAGISFMFLNIMATISVALLVKGLERALNQGEETRAQLENEVARRAEIEASLAERERYYRTTFEQTGTAMMVMAEDATITLVNQRFVEMSGYSKAELEGNLSWHQFVVPEELDRLVEFSRQRWSEGGAPEAYDFSFQDRDGKVRQVVNYVQLIPGTGFAVSSVLDVTERRRAERELADREKRYRVLLAIIPDPVVVYDQKGAVTYINQAFVGTYGWSLDELQGRRIDFVPAEESEITQKAWLRQMAGKDVLFESRRYTKRGKVIDVEICGASLMDGQGRYEAALVIHRDITDRKRVEMALKASEEKFSTAFDQAPVWVVITSLDQGLFLDVNQAFLRTTGYTREQVLGKDSVELGLWVDPTDRARILDELSQNGYVRSIEVQRRGKDGSVLDMLFSGEVISYGDQKCLLSVSQDVTAFKKVEERYRQSEEQFRGAFEGAPMGMALADLDRRMIRVNRRLCEMLGYSEAEMVGRDFNDFTHPDDRAGGVERFERFLSGQEEFNQSEKRYLHKDGSVVWVLASNSLVRNAQGRPSHAVSHMLDITQRQKAQQALEESERRFRLTFATTPESIAISRLQDGCFVEINQGFCDLTSYREDEVIGRTADELGIWADPDDREKLVELLRKGGTVRNMETTFRGKSGRLIPSLLSAAVLSLNGMAHLITITRDVEKWKLAKQAIEESEEKARAIQEAAPDPLVVYDEQGLCTFLNPSFTRVFGWSFEDLKGKRVPFLPESEKDRTFHQIQQVYEQEAPVSFVTRRQTKDGRLLDVVISAAGIKDSGGQVVGMVVNLTDISQRRTMELALESSEKRYRDLVDNITDFIYTHDLKGRFLSVNRAASQTLGYRPEDLIGRTVPDIMPPNYREAFFTEYMLELQKKGHHQGLSIYLDAQGAEHYLEYRSELVREKDTPPYVRGSARDVSERIEAEREQRQLEEQLFQAQKMEALGTLTGGVAHDFNNLLAAIMGNLGLVRRKLDAAHPCQHYLENAAAAASRAAAVTKQLLTTARRAERRVQPLKLGRLIQDTVGLLSETIDRRIAMEVAVEPDLHWVSADEAQISQVIMNLAVNARDAVLQTMAGGTGGGQHHIKVSARNLTVAEGETRSSALAYAGSFVELSVADSGCGMDPETLERIYEPFFTTKSGSEGTGLGLATVYGIMDQHRGWIEVNSAPGRGTVFKVYLPAAEPAQDHEPAQPQSTQDPSGHETVLVVDDEQMVLDIAREALQSLGYKVMTAKDGAEALEVYDRHGPEIQVVLLDMTMPRLSGKDVTKSIFQQNPEARIIISSGNITGGDLPLGAELSKKVSFLHKPYDLTDLAQTMRQVLKD